MPEYLTRPDRNSSTGSCNVYASKLRPWRSIPMRRQLMSWRACGVCTPKSMDPLAFLLLREIIKEIEADLDRIGNSGNADEGA
jgi:hypothetical protein